MQEKLLAMLTQEDDVTWKSLLTNLVKSEQMDPWDIDISYLAKRFLETIKELKEYNFRISGKVVLAAAILLRMKSVKLLDEHIKDLDSMIAQSQQQDAFYEELEQEFYQQGVLEQKHQPGQYPLIPKTPQPRKRKISMYDLIDALHKALEVQDRRLVRRMEYATPTIEIPTKKWDLGAMIETLYTSISQYYQSKESSAPPLTFTNLIPSQEKEAKVMTLMPLLHLSHQRKINLEQATHFADIEIFLVSPATVASGSTSVPTAQ